MPKFTVNANIFNLEALGSASAWIAKIFAEAVIGTTQTEASGSPIKGTILLIITPIMRHCMIIIELTTLKSA